MKRPPNVLTETEVRALLNGCSKRAPTGKRNTAMLTMMVRTGMRVGEVLALTVRDVDLELGVVHVQHGKGDKARRLGMDPVTVATTARWLDVRPKSRGPLFCTLKGGPIDSSYVRHLLRRLAVKGSVEGRVHPHALRHTFTAEMIREGTNIVVLRDCLGHSSLAVTDRYARTVEPADVLSAMRDRAWDHQRSPQSPVVQPIPASFGTTIGAG